MPSPGGGRILQVSAMLTGAVTGEEREKLWEDFRKFQIEGAAEEEEAEAKAAAETAADGGVGAQVDAK